MRVAICGGPRPMHLFEAGLGGIPDARAAMDEGRTFRSPAWVGTAEVPR
jgi:hypothetical protein